MKFNFSNSLKTKLLIGACALVVSAALSIQLISGELFKKGPQLAQAVEAGYCENGWTFIGGDAASNDAWVEGCWGGNTTQGTAQGTTQGTTQGNVEEPQPQPAPAVTWTLDQYGECDWSTNTVWNVEVSSTGERRRTNIARTNAPECGYVAPQAPAPQAPAPQAPAPQPMVTERVVERVIENTQVISNNTNNNQNVNNNKVSVNVPQGAPMQPVYQAPVVQQVAPVVCPDGYTRQVSNFSVTCIPPVVNSPSVRVVTAEVNCPEGYTRTTNGSQVTCTAPAPKVVTVAGSQELKELPKTGLPVAAWALMGLLPAGAKLRKFGSEKEDLITAASIWEERQFKRA